MSRPTVLKALGILKQDGWIESQQGKGSFVRGRPAAGRTSPDHARDAVELDETGDTEILHVPADEPAMSVVITVHQASGDPIMTSVLVMPGSRHEIEETYAVS